MLNNDKLAWAHVISLLFQYNRSSKVRGLDQGPFTSFKQPIGHVQVPNPVMKSGN